MPIENDHLIDLNGTSLLILQLRSRNGNSGGISLQKWGVPPSPSLYAPPATSSERVWRAPHPDYQTLYGALWAAFGDTKLTINHL